MTEIYVSTDVEADGPGDLDELLLARRERPDAGERPGRCEADPRGSPRDENTLGRNRHGAVSRI